jgi:GT2 family glycosyltransferase
MKKNNQSLRELASKAYRILKDEGTGRLLTVSKNYLFGPKHIDAVAADIGHSAQDLEKLRLEKLRAECRAFTYRPKISIVLPAGNRDPRRLRPSLDSVLNQVYDNWELCIAVDRSVGSGVGELPENDATRDERITVRFLNGHHGVSDLSNAAIGLATGEFIGFLDQGDELAPSALYEVAHLLEKARDADFIYSDEILLDASGVPVYTYYRPDFSMDYMLSHCYINHFSVIRRALVNKIGGFRSAFEVSREYDLFLRVFSETKRVFHIPKALYLSRQHGSDPGQATMSDVMDSSRKAIRDFLDREGIGADVCDAGHFNFFRVKRRIIGNPKVTIIIPTKDKADLLKRCIGSIEDKTLYKDYDIIVVDNQSCQAETLEYLADLQRQRGNCRVLPFREGFNFSRINNYAVQYASGEHLLFLNNDVEIIAPEWLGAMLEHSQREDIGCVGAKLLYPDGKLQHVGVVIGLYGGADHIYKWHESRDIGYMGQFVSIRNCSAVTAACMMVKKALFAEVGGFDASFKVGFGDTDFCLRVQEKGYLNIFTPFAELYHHESASRGQSPEIDPHLEDTKRLMKRWRKIIQEGDPFYNPNLPLHSQPLQGQKVFQRPN